MEFQRGNWLACDSVGTACIHAIGSTAIAGKPAPTEKQIHGAT